MKVLLWKPLLIAGLTALSLSQPVMGAETLALVLDQAWRIQPQARALDTRDAEARAVQEIANRLTPEPGSLSISERGDRYNGNAGMREVEIEIATPLWLPGQKSAQRAVGASRMEEAAAYRLVLRWEIAGEVRNAWWTLAAARNAMTLATRNRDTALNLATEVQRRFKVGDLSRMDANVAQMEARSAESTMLDAQTSLLQEEQRFRVLTGLAAPLAIQEEMPAEQSSRQPQTHPQFVAAIAQAHSAHAKRKLVDQSQRSAPELALRMVRERADMFSPTANSVGIRLKIPFSSGAQVRRDTSAAQAEAEIADAELQRLQLRLELDFQHAQQTLQATQRQAALASERRALSADNLQLAEKSFSLGESDLSSLLRSRAAANEAEAFLLQQTVARGAAISRLNQAMGVLP